MNELLGYSAEEARERFARINALIEALYERFPSLGRIGATVPLECEACDAEVIAERWEHYSKVLAAELGKGAGALRAPAKGPLKCNLTKIVAGFYGCALRSKGSLLVYAVCGYGVFCASCDGGIADYIC